MEREYSVDFAVAEELTALTGATERQEMHRADPMSKKNLSTSNVSQRMMFRSHYFVSRQC
jgi:hypothetical protein